MFYPLKYKDIIIAEGNPDKEYTVLGEVDCTLGGFYSQMKSLNDVKETLYQQAKLLNANAIINFTYGQKKKFFSLEGVVFYGKGVAVKFRNIESILDLCK
nr:hypothetical protein [Clostridia bacterium]